ncbi:MAG: ribonuclease PH [Burkholderiales bacterium]|nr:ribonuclease PH [Burkholderiales bacterium]
MKSPRSYQRAANELRPLSFELHWQKHPDGSVLVSQGGTRVICSVSVEETVPSFVKAKGTGEGWLTAEYGMLPSATHTRTRREVSEGKPSGRTHEIQRLIGRSLRAVVDCAALGERTVRIDCDVIEADGGTRCASITGAWVALVLAQAKMRARGLIVEPFIRDQIAALSVGIVQGEVLVDLDYSEDSQCDADMNIIMTGNHRFVEIQATAEDQAFPKALFLNALSVAEEGIARIQQAQKEALDSVIRDQRSGIRNTVI